MATKSIFKDVRIENLRLTKDIVSILENARNMRSEEVKFKKEVEEVRAEDIKKYFDV